MDKFLSLSEKILLVGIVVMLIRFTLENWMSFRDQVVFSMVAGRERQHARRVPVIDRYNLKVLPVAAIYGGNASGKTNFFKALNFARALIVRGTPPDGLIPIETFRPDRKCEKLPVRFSFEILIEEVIYEFSFVVTRQMVLEERLVRITPTTEKVLYHRKDDKPNFDGQLNKDQFLHFAFKGTRDNQLFLTNSVSQRVDAFKPVYDWFRDTLELVAPDSRFEPFEQFLDEKNPLYSRMNTLLFQLDTGISRLGGEDVSIDSLPVAEALKIKLQDDVREGVTVRLTSPLNERFVVTRREGELVARKLITYHPDADGKESRFEIWQESDGSQRVIDLLPAFLELSAESSKRVYIIDELDRSLHTQLTWKLLEEYLSRCSGDTRTQLLFTTHDLHLMDQDLLRRDEIWIAERDMTGSSTLISFSEFKDVRSDKDIRKSYLLGRMGGIPRLRIADFSVAGNGVNTSSSRGD